MKFHFGNHHYDRGTADNGQLAVMAPVHPSSPLFMDAHHHDNTAAANDECHQNSSLSAEIVAAMTTTTEEQCHHDASCSASALVANNNEAVENDPPPPPVHPRVNKSRHFFRIKGRRSRSSSPVSEESSSTSTTIMTGQPKEMSEQQHRLNVMDLLRPARMRRSTSLPHPASATAASSSSTTASTTVTNSSHSSSTSTTTNNYNKPKHKRSVTFTCIQIREYNTILGDHPCCESGPPLALGWEYNKNDEVIMGIDDYENTFVDSSDENGSNDQNDESMTLHRRRRLNELRLNCEDRREILCGLMKVEDVVDATTTTVTATTMMEDDSNENQPQLLCPLQQELHSSDTSCFTTQSVSSSHTKTSEATTASAPTPLYTKEELRKAERKLERERRGFTGNAARTRRRLKRGFFMPLTPEEEESYKANCCSGGVVRGSEDDESLDHSSSDDDENGVVGMDISPKKESSTRSL